MSLITDLLKKVEPGKSSGADFPPGLKRVVLESTRKKGDGRSRVTTLGSLALGISACGVAALFAVDYLQKPLPKTKRPAATATVAPAPVAPPISAPPVVSPPSAAQTEADILSVTSAARDVVPVKTSSRHKTGGMAPKDKPAHPHIQAIIPAGHMTAEIGRQPNGLLPSSTPMNSRHSVSPAAKKLSPDELATRDYHLYAARSAEARGDNRLALEQYRKALVIDKNNFMLINNTAGALIRLGATDEATGLLNRCLELKPEYVPALVNKGVIAIKSGNNGDGELWLNKALTVDPGNRHALANSGLLKEKSKDFKSASAVYRRLAETGDGQGYIGMGRIAETEGNRTDAAKIYRSGLAREGLSSDVRRQLNDRLGIVEK